MTLIIILFWLAFFIVLLPLGYLLLFALSSARASSCLEIHEVEPSRHFAIVIPAHNEEAVIEKTVSKCSELNFPKELFEIHVIADYCNDQTAAEARKVGAFVHERFDGERNSKGAALSWGFDRILSNNSLDAIVVFDADTQVDPNFLQFMNAHLVRGNLIIQGQHIIRNFDRGWFSSLIWAMFIIDNRYQNYGRSCIGLSAKNMGDSIVFHSDVIRKMGWGKGLTDDYQLRQKILLEGLKIHYEPRAKGYGEAPFTLVDARNQRIRWLKGARETTQKLSKQLLNEGIKQRDLVLLDGAIQSYLPSYSTLTLICSIIFLLMILINILIQPLFPINLIAAWGTVVAITFLYPYFGLFLERAPTRAYIAILLGTYFIIWRTVLAVSSRISRRPIQWLRTPHGDNL